MHEADRVPDTLRFLDFPPTVQIGLPQSMHREPRVERRLKVLVLNTDLRQTDPLTSADTRHGDRYHSTDPSKIRSP